MDPKHIRNFSIIAHIDHGKSTLADRMLEITGTIEKRKMQEQVLDSMELERERGITIKMQPVRMNWRSSAGSESNGSTIAFPVEASTSVDFRASADRLTDETKTLRRAEEGKGYAKLDAISTGKADGQQEYILNLIDTPGHIDFSYEVSRSLRAVEGSILLVDATQGVQAQTLTTLNMAKEAGLTIIPVVSKIDSPLARTEDVVAEMCQLLKCSKEDVLKVSGKTGEGVAELLDEVIRKVPPPFGSVLADQKSNGLSSAASERTLPRTSVSGAERLVAREGNVFAKEAGSVNGAMNEYGSDKFRSLVFDFQYSNHTGVIVYIRVMNGTAHRHDKLVFKIADKVFEAIEVGIFKPDNTPVESLSAGEIGYIVTGIKEPGIASVGDTVASVKDTLSPLDGYQSPRPVVWASIYPESQDQLPMLRQALGRLRLSDSSFTYEEEASGTLGKGYRCGFLGMLHLEIVTERLRREFNLELVVTMPTITYTVKNKNGKTSVIYSPSLFPDDHDIVDVSEPVVTMKIITPPEYIGSLMTSVYEHEGLVTSTDNFGDNRTMLTVIMPLRELMRNFFDEVKSLSSGYASISYDITDNQHADVVRMDVLVADEPVPAFARVVSRRRIPEEAETTVEKLYKILPRELFTFKVQAQALGRILSSRSISGKKKDAATTLSGGDITRKMKLREKQKEGRKRLKEHGSVNIPQDVFVKMMRNG
ncbi:MAG: GTP-binding protein [Candidatus Taylorbacteria bacterium]|nr:GTP-binding protein [Candidatus Taylorbacteria bacterium]